MCDYDSRMVGTAPLAKHTNLQRDKDSLPFVTNYAICCASAIVMLLQLSMAWLIDAACISLHDCLVLLHCYAMLCNANEPQ
jgi:hypothetical protein